jgi:hypothetical protein
LLRDSDRVAWQDGAVATSHHFVIRDDERDVQYASFEQFDRIAFAMWVLKKLRPPMTVAVFRGHRRLSIQEGRDLERGPHARWAMVSIPPHASRERIAQALTELAGMDRQPFVLDLLVSLGREIRQS